MQDYVHVLFDDLIIFESDPCILPQLVHMLVTECFRIGLVINVENTIHLCLYKRRNIYPPRITCSGELSPFSIYLILYLGCTQHMFPARSAPTPHRVVFLEPRSKKRKPPESELDTTAPESELKTRAPKLDAETNAPDSIITFAVTAII